MGGSVRPEPDPVEAYKRRFLAPAAQDATAQDPVAAYRAKYVEAPSDYAKGLATSVAQGATFGFADEALGGIDALDKALSTGTLKNLQRDYAATRDRIRGTEANFAANNPKTHVAANVAGGFVDAPLFAMKAAPTLVGRIGQGIDAGIVGGATAGIGASTAPTFSGQMEDAARGAMVGSAVGAAVPVAGKLLGSAGGKVLDATGRRPVSYTSTPKPPGANRFISRLLADPSEGVGVDRGVNANQATQARVDAMNAQTTQTWRQPQPQATAPNSLLNRTMQTMGVQSVEERALDMIQRAMDRDGLTLEQATQKAAGAFSMEPNTLMELAGRNMKRLGRGALTAPGHGSDVMANTLESRARGEEETILDNFYGKSGLGGKTNVRQTIDQLADQREAEAAKNYGPIYDKTVDDPSLGKFFEDPSFKSAYDRARRIQMRKGIASGDEARLPPIDELLNEDGTLKRPLTVREADRIKRGLDDVLQVGQRSPLDDGGLGNEEIASLREAKNAFVKKIDAQVPEYANARDAFAGKSAMMDALDQGRKIFSRKVDDAEADYAQLSTSEKEMFRRGAAEAFRDRIESVAPGNDINRRVFDKTTDARRLALVFDNRPDDLQAFGERAAASSQRFRTRNFLGAQSNTADKLAELGELAGVSLDDVIDAATGNTHGILKRTATRLLGKGEANLSEQTGEQIANRLTAGARPGTTIQSVLEELRRNQAAKANQRSVFAPATAGTTAGSIAQQPRSRTP